MFFPISLPAGAAPEVAPQRAHMVSLYSSYADGYDQAAAADGYFSPGRIAHAMAATLTDRQSCILDVACGTGLVGLELQQIGYRNLTGVDIVLPMLSRAQAKNCYGLVVLADVNTPLPFAARTFDAISCAGAFYDDNLRANALENLLPLLKPRGYLFCDIEMHAWTHYGFREVFEHPDSRNVFAELNVEPAQLFRAPDDTEQQGYYVTLRMA